LGIEGGNFTPVNVARAAMEALAMEFGRGLRRMMQLGLSPAEVRLSGSSSAHPAWRQLLADVLGLHVLSSGRESGAALGAALQAAVTFFHQSGEDLTFAEMTSYATLPEEQTLCVPEGSRHEFYRDLMGRHEQLGELLAEGADR
jgi:xylulokinase